MATPVNLYIVREYEGVLSVQSFPASEAEKSYIFDRGARPTYHRRLDKEEARRKYAIGPTPGDALEAYRASRLRQAQVAQARADARLAEVQTQKELAQLADNLLESGKYEVIPYWSPAGGWSGFQEQ